MRIRSNDQPRDLWSDICAPRVGIREEEALALGPAVVPFIVERLALLLEVCLECSQREPDAAIVRCIFSLRQQAILFYSCSGIGHFLRVLLRDALAALVVFLCVVGR